MLVRLKTDERVHEVIKIFQDALEWSVEGKIDSVNYGEGYDLRFCGVPVRLYDDERSDEVELRLARKTEGSWDEIFRSVSRDMAGQVSLNFEIDRHDEASLQLHSQVARSIKEILIKGGYAESAIIQE